MATVAAGGRAIAMASGSLFELKGNNATTTASGANVPNSPALGSLRADLGLMGLVELVSLVGLTLCSSLGLGESTGLFGCL